MNTAAQPMYGWEMIRWAKVERAVFKLRCRIFRASLPGDRRTVHTLQRLLSRSWSARVLTVRRVTQDNRGKRTAGVDGVSSVAPVERFPLAQSLSIGRPASPLRRVWIPKPGSQERRPLGIPTIRDRATQALALLALEPEWEARFEPNSYGFRPGRCCWDAIGAIFLAVKHKSKWVLDADIEKCYDRIDHDALLEKLQTYPRMRRQIRAWLKAGVIDGDELFPTEEGAPQGGPLSCLLANVALHGLESAMQRAASRREGAPLVVRYADDFAVLHPDREVIERCRETASAWLAQMGLKLKEAKTRVTHTLFSGEHEPGFTFLGYCVMQYPAGRCRTGKNTRGKPLGFKTLIRPSKEAVKRHADELRTLIDANRWARQRHLVERLNRKIRGWSNYYSTVCSKRTFTKLDHVLYAKLWRWARWRHPKKSRRWIAAKYWRVQDGEGWVFRPRCSETSLHQHHQTPIRRHAKVQAARSPFDGDWVYWSTRAGAYTGTNRWVAQLLKKQRGRCEWCGLHFFPTDRVEVDHIIARRLGGRTIYGNLQLLHGHCHDAKSAQDLREQLATEQVIEEIRGMYDTHRNTEEPCDSKESRTVLKPSRPGDGPA